MTVEQTPQPNRETVQHVLELVRPTLESMPPHHGMAHMQAGLQHASFIALSERVGASIEQAQLDKDIYFIYIKYI